MNQVVIILAVLSVVAIILALSQGALDPGEATPPAPVELLPTTR
jgi:hypothetical protein